MRRLNQGSSAYPTLSAKCTKDHYSVSLANALTRPSMTDVFKNTWMGYNMFTSTKLFYHMMLKTHTIYYYNIIITKFTYNACLVYVTVAS